MNGIKIKSNQIQLFYDDRKETWVKTTSTINLKNFIQYDGYTYIMKEVE